MCDQDDFDAMLQSARKTALSRREFGALSVGAGLASMLPVANAMEVNGSDVEIATADGKCDAYFVHPAKGTHPGVLIWPDIFGLRPTFRQMADRLSQSGYSVLVINPFYRIKQAPTANGTDMSDPMTRENLMSMMRSLTPETTLTDAKAFVPWLDKQAAVNKQRKLATTGYCMGGPLTLRTAAAFPDRIGAGASFHGAALVTDKPDSPHLLVPKIKAHYLFAIAASDDQQAPNVKTTLRDTFAAAKLPAEVEVYAGTKHGWCPPDTAVHDTAQAEKAWTQQLALFKRALA
jgi:carboxymethylenebutenolidase